MTWYAMTDEKEKSCKDTKQWINPEYRRDNRIDYT